MELEFRKSEIKDIPSILSLIKQAQEDFHKAGIDQWQDGYPNEEIILYDINARESYVVLLNNEIIATAMISFRGEPTYSKIEGEWITNNPYAVIHRIAVDRKMKGLGIAGRIIDQTIDLCKIEGINNIRIDTHQANIPMQQVASKAGFRYCGIITLNSGALRLAYEMEIAT